MFEHSVKVPRLYKEIAKVVTDVKEKGSSLKNLVYSAKHKVSYIHVFFFVEFFNDNLI